MRTASMCKCGQEMLPTWARNPDGDGYVAGDPWCPRCDRTDRCGAASKELASDCTGTCEGCLLDAGPAPLDKWRELRHKSIMTYNTRARGAWNQAAHLLDLGAPPAEVSLWESRANAAEDDSSCESCRIMQGWLHEESPTAYHPEPVCSACPKRA